MKKTVKILLLTLSLVMIFGTSILPVFAAEASKEAGDVSFPVKETIEINGEVIHLLEDGTAYNQTTQQWILEEKEGLAFETNLDRMLSSLQYMWKGMLCIFIVIAVIILSVVIMNTISAKAQERKELKENEDDQN